jgi:hypothetical protein
MALRFSKEPVVAARKIAATKARKKKQQRLMFLRDQQDTCLQKRMKNYRLLSFTHGPNV